MVDALSAPPRADRRGRWRDKRHPFGCLAFSDWRDHFRGVQFGGTITELSGLPASTVLRNMWLSPSLHAVVGPWWSWQRRLPRRTADDGDRSDSAPGCATGPSALLLLHRHHLARLHARRNGCGQALTNWIAPGGDRIAKRSDRLDRAGARNDRRDHRRRRWGDVRNPMSVALLHKLAASQNWPTRGSIGPAGD